MTSATKLIQELREARADERKALEELDAAKDVVSEKKDAVRKTRDRIEEILEEMETGKSRTPLFPAAIPTVANGQQ